jgi:hypothetical protein
MSISSDGDEACARRSAMGYRSCRWMRALARGLAVILFRNTEVEGERPREPAPGG